MAIVTNNMFTQGLTGTIGGDMVFRTFRGKTVVSIKPSQGGPVKESASQRANRDRFRQATVYAKAAMADAQKKSYYQRRARKLKLPNAYTAAITDYMRRPKLEQVDRKRYKGKAGNVIVVSVAKKGFSVSAVAVTVTDASGVVVESGPAVRLQADLCWRYVARNTVHLGPGVTLTITVTDAAGQLSKWTVTA